MENKMLKEQIVTADAKPVIDEGLRKYMLKVYNYMAGGLIASALTVYTLLSTGLIAAFFNISEYSASLSPLGWIVLLSPLVMVFVFGRYLRSGSIFAVQTCFWLFSVLMGASIAPIMLLYTGASITRVFLISAAMFGSLSIYGYTTKRDLTGMGTFLYMGLWGLIIASIVNIFWGGSAVYFAISVIGVAIFVGLTAYDTQKIRQMYVAGDEELAHRAAISGALELYLDFVNLFLYLLRLFGDRK